MSKTQVICYSSIKNFSEASKIIGGTDVAAPDISGSTVDDSAFIKYCEDNFEQLCEDIMAILMQLKTLIPVYNESDAEVIIYTIVLMCIKYLKDETGIEYRGGCRHKLSRRISSSIALNGYPDFIIYRLEPTTAGRSARHIELIVEAKNLSMDTMVKGEGQLLLEFEALKEEGKKSSTTNYGVVTNATEWWFYSYKKALAPNGKMENVFQNIGKFHLVIDDSDLTELKKICKMILSCTLS